MTPTEAMIGQLLGRPDDALIALSRTFPSGALGRNSLHSVVDKQRGNAPLYFKPPQQQIQGCGKILKNFQDDSPCYVLNRFGLDSLTLVWQDCRQKFP